jgi:DNA-binding transcriptional regulator YhcF (GntR family)
MFLSVKKIRKMFTFPADIMNDPNVSIGAKGLYVQLQYSNDTICSLNELCTFVNSTEEELKKYFNELTETGYITITDNKCELLTKPVTSRSSKKTDVEESAKYAETVQEKKKNAYEIMVDIVNEYELAQNVKNLLITFFDNWFRGKGRYAEASKLNRGRVRQIIGNLIGYHLTEEEQIECIKHSIDKQYYDLFDIRKSGKAKEPIFDSKKLKSDTYSEDEMEDLMKRLAQRNGEDEENEDSEE